MSSFQRSQFEQLVGEALHELNEEQRLMEERRAEGHLDPSRWWEIAWCPERITDQESNHLELCDTCRRAVERFREEALPGPAVAKKPAQLIPDQDLTILPMVADKGNRREADSESEPGLVVIALAADWMPLSQVAASATDFCTLAIPMERFPEPVRKRLPWIQELKLTCLPDQSDSSLAKYSVRVALRAGAIGGSVRVVLEWPDHSNSKGQTTLSSDCRYRNWLDNMRLPSDRRRIVIRVDDSNQELQ